MRRASSSSTARCPSSATSSSSPSWPRRLELLAAKGADGFYKGAFAKKLVAGVQQLGGNWTRSRPRQLQGRRACAGRRPLPRRAHRLRLAADLGRHRADRRAQHPRGLRSRRSSTRSRARISSSKRCAACIAIAPCIWAIRISSTCPSRGSSTSTMPRASAPRSAWTARRRAPSLPGVDAPSPGHFNHAFLGASTRTATWSPRRITLNFFFGSGLMVPGTGILLNNQMDDFSVKPGVPNGFQLIGADANAIAPKQAAAVVVHADVRRRRRRAS